MANNEMPSPMWRMPVTGVTSEDFINRKNQNNPRAHYGFSWRFKKDQDAKNDKLKAQAEKAAAKKKELELAGKTPPPDPADPKIRTRSEAEDVGEDVHDPEDDKAAIVLHSNENTEMPAYSEDDLKALPYDQLVEYAAALGIANTRMKKAKLIDAILDKQN